MRTMVANITSMTLWQASSYLIPLLTFPYLTRTLGVVAFGEYGLAFAIATYLMMVVDWGFALSASGAIARHRDDRDRMSAIFWETLLAKALLLLLCLAGLVIAVLLLPGLRMMAATLFAAAGMVLANVLTVNWCLQGLERMGSFATAATIGKALTVPATFLLVHSPSDAWIAAAIQSGGSVAGGLISILLLRRLGVIGWTRATLGGALGQVRDGWHLFVSALSAGVYSSANPVVLGAFGGATQLGVYAAADRLRSAAQGLISPISQAVYPHSMRVMAQDPVRGLAFARRLLLAQGAFTLAISLVMFFGADLIIRILAGEAFLAAVPTLRILAPVPFVVGIGNVLGVQMMLPLDMKAQFSRILAGAALVYLATVVPLVLFGGANGAAAATLLAESYGSAAMALALYRRGAFHAPKNAVS